MIWKLLKIKNPISFWDDREVRAQLRQLSELFGNGIT